jgi:hypothetical protein
MQTLRVEEKHIRSQMIYFKNTLKILQLFLAERGN